MAIKVIGITGPKRSGKNTVATLAGCLSDLDFIQVSLADTIKDGFDRLSGPGRELHKDLDKHAWTNRKAWQQAGTEARDMAGDPLVWCQVAKVWIVYLSEIHPKMYRRFVIPDIRFPHEEVFFREHVAKLGGEFQLWGVTSDRVVQDESHSSEQCYWQLTPDALIKNNLSKWTLAGVVNDLLRTTVADWGYAADLFAPV